MSGSKGRKEKRHLDELLDEGLKGTFPASDPVSIGQFTGSEAPRRPIDRDVVDLTTGKKLKRGELRRRSGDTGNRFARRMWRVPDVAEAEEPKRKSIVVTLKRDMQGSAAEKRVMFEKPKAAGGFANESAAELRKVENMLRMFAAMERE
jgi:hypothetical protein